jgi:hypothetical protein
MYFMAALPIETNVVADDEDERRYYARSWG